MMMIFTYQKSNSSSSKNKKDMRWWSSK